MYRPETPDDAFARAFRSGWFVWPMIFVGGFLAIGAVNLAAEKLVEFFK